MLFSNDDIARLINENFEPAWVSVREVPIVRIDFGRGRTITRTLHGNIATYVCDREGRVLDILPGIYDIPTYRRELEKLLALHTGYRASNDRQDFLRRYHLGNGELAPAAGNVRLDVSKTVRIEPPIEQLVSSRPATASRDSEERIDSLRAALTADARGNEMVRRRQIHRRLAVSGSVTPDELTRWLYREVLEADLDDPYLGLADLLFKDYPFTDEDT